MDPRSFRTHTPQVGFHGPEDSSFIVNKRETMAAFYVSTRLVGANQCIYTCFSVPVLHSDDPNWKTSVRK